MREFSIYRVFILCKIQIDYEEFIALDDYNKKKVALELLMKGIRRVASDQKWSMIPFEEAYEEIVKANYVNRWVWQKSARNKETKMRARILLCHEVKQIDIYMCIEDKKGNEVHKEKLITERPSEWAYAGYLGSIYWESNDKVVLRSKREDQEFVVNFLSNNHIDS
jgi:hypothetical protein